MIEEFEGKGVTDQETEFPWNQVGEGTTSVTMIIEPGETEQMTYDFLISHEIEAILVSAWVSNASESKTTDGWYRRMPHIRPEAQKYGRSEQESKGRLWHHQEGKRRWSGQADHAFR